MQQYFRPLPFFRERNPVKKKPPERTSTRRLPPIVVVPDKSYIDDTGNVIPTDVTLVSDPTMYLKMQQVLAVWGKQPIGIPGQRGIIEG